MYRSRSLFLNRTIARDERENVIESSRRLSETAHAEPKTRALVLASHRPERPKGIFGRANLAIRMVVLCRGGLAVRLVHLNFPAVDGSGAVLVRRGRKRSLITHRYPSP